MFILVDQFEEIFRFGLRTENVERREHAAEFVALLLHLAEQEEYPFYICLTMRSDYLGDCVAYVGLPEAMNRSQYLVPRLIRYNEGDANLLTGSDLDCALKWQKEQRPNKEWAEQYETGEQGSSKFEKVTGFIEQSHTNGRQRSPGGKQRPTDEGKQNISFLPA